MRFGLIRKTLLLVFSSSCWGFLPKPPLFKEKRFYSSSGDFVMTKNPNEELVDSNSDDGFPILARRHEKALFVVYAISGSALLQCSNLHFASSAVALTWSTMILGISFTEAWVKFQAPFLPKAVAVDVGRHVFAAKQSTELGLCTAFWSSRRWSRTTTVSNSLLAVATFGLLIDAVLVSPKLYQRAKYKIVEDLSNNKDWLEDKAKRELATLSRQVNHKDFRLPSRTWHTVYGIIELLKVVCLDMFAYASWKMG